MDWDNLVFNCCGFIAGLFLLHYGADLFVDHTAIIARRLKIPETLIILLTVGAEWEELAVVIASIVQHQPSLGLGNVVGSCVANVLGAFAFGLLARNAHNNLRCFDTNSKIYAGALLVVSSMYLYLALMGHLDLTGGIFFLVAFGVYVMSICSAIYDRILTPSTPISNAMDESLSSSEDTSDDFHRELQVSIYPSVLQCPPNEDTPLVGEQPPPRRMDHSENAACLQSAAYHIARSIVGITALVISAYLLVHTSSSLSSILHLSPTSFGITFLSFFTTIPEKVPAALASWQDRPQNMAASTAGANIFLLTLCLGIIFLTGNGDEELARSITAFEVWSVWGCSLVLTLIVLLRGKRWMGGILLGFYVAFLGVEVTISKR
ncbi:hypothetical protein EG329_012803 [Mollisiaceae sp. DMI_Dod_QoI]|nr:hypothetical protein EG329_012803 [Helotiales sp. DMI_Dod_QoI]